jgi:AcrR family transcriptional regulator
MVMGRAKFNDADFTGAALAIAAERGPLAVTVGSITERLGAPTGSFYHRFASRDVLLGELWLQTVLDFQKGTTAALDAGDGLRAALHIPVWVREHLDEARLLLLHHRDDFVQGEWPQSLRERVAAQAERMAGGFARAARLIFGRARSEEIRRAQFMLAEVPVAAVRRHIERREPPPPMVEELIRITYYAVVDDYRTRKQFGDADGDLRDADGIR